LSIWGIWRIVLRQVAFMEFVIDKKKINGLQLVESIENGLSFSTFESVVKQYSVAMQDLAATIGITQRTLTRRKVAKKLSKTESDRLVSVRRMLDQATELFENDKIKSNQWLSSPNRGLGGRTPLQMAQTETGLREVENLIFRLEHGVFS
jgi:putative toxin-antitoxin system antitoxin component (TIGR02293 family)